VSIRALTFAVLAVGFVLWIVGLYGGGTAVRWAALALLGVASVLALWIKWGLNGHGWELRRARRQ
jgi:hypothetical protein